MTAKLPFYIIPKEYYFEPNKEWIQILFLPDCDASAGRMVSYERVGQHGEADMCFYRFKCRNVNSKRQADSEALLKEYQSMLDDTEELAIVKRDRESFRRTRYAWMKYDIDKSAPGSIVKK